MFRDVTSDSQLKGLQASLKIDRDRASTLGVSIDAIRSALRLRRGVAPRYLPPDSYRRCQEYMQMRRNL